MTRKKLLDFHEDFCARALGIMSAKNHDYAGESGADPFANFRAVERLGLCSTETGILVRMTDKLKRLATFAECGKLDVVNEGAEDACLDIVNYAILLAGVIKEKTDGE